MFVDTELAGRIEAAEVSLLRDILTVATQSPHTAAWAVEVAGGLAGYTGPGAPFNKLAGLGFGGEFDAELGGSALDEVESRCQASGVPVVVEFASLADPAWLELLGERGYRLVGIENVLGCSLGAGELPAGAGVSVTPLEPGGDLDPWIEVLLDGFAAPDAQGVPSHETFPRAELESAMRELAAVAGFRAWHAELDGQIVGGGGLRCSGAVAHLCGAATAPAFRRRGVQRTLVAARLRAAREAGCELAVTVTQPGSSSQQNMQRFGFELLYVRNVLVRAMGDG